MQTIQLLPDARPGSSRSARRALAPGGLVALAIAADARAVRGRRAAAAGRRRARRHAVPVAADRGARGAGRHADRAPAAHHRAGGERTYRGGRDRARRRSAPASSRPRAPPPGCGTRACARSPPRPTTSAPRWCCCVADLVLRVGALYPDLLNIYADRGNLLLLERRCAWRGIGFELRGIGLRRGVRPRRARPALHRRRPGPRPGAVRARHERVQARRPARRRRARSGRLRRLRRLPAARPRLPARRRGACPASASSTSRPCARTGRG